ncbi:MAG TPA: YetF domain-containing protein [Burkholderiaceae bacterium]|nr:YetF domain-containing protein [Burkholderiaceae bacterium]
MNWGDLFGLTVSPLEIFVRGSIVYWFIFLIFRLVLRREVGAIGVADVLVVVLIADASQNAMAGDYRSITDGLLLISTIVFWNFLLDWLAFRWRWLAHVLEPPPLVLIEDGRMNRANMRREFLTPDELRSKLRENGVEDLAQVKRALMESDGEISVIRLNGAETDRDRSPRPA